MQRHARDDRQWEQWPGRGAPTRRHAGRLRGLFAPSDAADAVAELVAERGRELEERSAEIRAVVQELEHREERARELHFKVEQILRDGAAELDLRQAELSVRSAELDARETTVEQAEAGVEDRRRALGAVELRAAAVDRREEAVRLRERGARASGRRARRARPPARRARQDPRSRRSRHPSARTSTSCSLRATATDLVVRPGPAPKPGELVELDDGPYRCLRVAGSPLPGDDRRCAVLEPAPAE